MTENEPIGLKIYADCPKYNNCDKGWTGGVIYGRGYTQTNNCDYDSICRQLK